VTQTIVIAVAAVVIALSIAAWLGRVRRSWRARRRAARAGAGEDAAALLLADAGFTVIAAQVRLIWQLTVDGEPFATELIADYLVEADGERLVAEVKTGALAPKLTTAATRRQLLEYRVAFGVDGVLLVSPERGTIQRVEFPFKNLPALQPPPRLNP
jgi:hypothetical protein